MTVKSPDPAKADNVHRSMGLKALLWELREGTPCSILDLGPALGGNVAFWSRFPCRIQIEDLHSSLADFSLDETEAWNPAVLDRMFCFTSDAQFDVILCWDLLNYLRSEQVTALLAHLARFCRPGALLFALFWLAPRIPDEPIIFRIIDAEHMEYINRTAKTRSWAGFQARDIGRFSDDFEISNSFLLRHSIQEYLFVCRARDAQPTARESRQVT
jgi:SAM-dependent methyltransferase